MPFLWMPLRPINMESTNPFEGLHNFRDILLGVNPEERLKEEGRQGSHTRGALGHMVAPERQAVQWEGNVH